MAHVLLFISSCCAPFHLLSVIQQIFGRERIDKKRKRGKKERDKKTWTQHVLILNSQWMEWKNPTYWIGNFIPYSIPFCVRAFVCVCALFNGKSTVHSSVNPIHLNELYITIRFVWLDVWCGAKCFGSIPLLALLLPVIAIATAQYVEWNPTKQRSHSLNNILTLLFSSCTFPIV